MMHIISTAGSSLQAGDEKPIWNAAENVIYHFWGMSYNQKITTWANMSFHLLLLTSSTGTTSSQKAKTFYNVGPSVPLNLTMTGIDSEAVENTAGFKVHGCLMSLAWLGTAPTGMIIARYYRKTWTSLKPCGKDSWFRCGMK